MAKFKNLPKWQKKLNAEERKHLKEMDITTLWQFRENAKAQKKFREEENDKTFEPCWTCRSIARKLNLPL